MNSIKIELLGIGIILLGIALSTNHFWAYTLGVIGFALLQLDAFGRIHKHLEETL